MAAMYGVLLFFIIGEAVVATTDDAAVVAPFDQSVNGCPACCTYASALRRTIWDHYTPSLNAQENLQTLAMDALLGVLQHTVYDPKRRRYAPYEALGRAGEITSQQRELALRHKAEGGDRDLLVFLHTKVLMALENAVSAYMEAALAAFAEADVEDYVRAPGSGICDPDFSEECLERMSSFRLLKDELRDATERIDVARQLCSSLCAEREIRTAMPLEVEDLGIDPLSLVHRAAAAARKRALDIEEFEQEQIRAREIDGAELEARKRRESSMQQPTPGDSTNDHGNEAEQRDL